MIHSQNSAYWMQHEVSFSVWEKEKCTGLLRIIPLGCEVGEQKEAPDAPRYAAYGIYVQVKIERTGIDCTGYDFIDPSQFRELLTVLNEAQTKAVLHGDEGGVDIRFARREDGLISVVGQIPATDGVTDSWFSTDPYLQLRDMKITVQFEFLLGPQQAIESRGELERLLEYVRGVEVSKFR